MKYHWSESFAQALESFEIYLFNMFFRKFRLNPESSYVSTSDCRFFNQRIMIDDIKLDETLHAMNDKPMRNHLLKDFT